MSLKFNLAAKIGLAVILTAGAGTGAYAYYTTQETVVSLPDFVGKDKRIVDIYATNAGIKDQVEYTYEFSEEYNENIVIEQSTRRVIDNAKLEITVSKGYDPDALFELPDFTDQTKEEIEEWFEQYHFSNVTYTYETVEDATITDDTFVSSNPEAGTEVLRTDEIIITLATTDITVPDLLSMSKSDIDSWASTYGITISYTTQESNLYEDDQILAVSTNEGDIVHRGDTISVTIAVHTETTEERTEEESTIQQTDTNSNSGTRDSNYSDNSSSDTSTDNNSSSTTDDSASTDNDNTNTSDSSSDEPVVTNACPSSIGPYALYDGYSVSEILGSISTQGCTINVVYASNPNSLQGVEYYSANGNSATLSVYVRD